MRIALALLLLALAACSPEIIYVTAPEAAPEPEPAAVAEAPVWQPEAGHVYILDAEDAIVTDYMATDAADYQWAVRAWGLTVDLHNCIDDPARPWYLVCGGPPA